MRFLNRQNDKKNVKPVQYRVLEDDLSMSVAELTTTYKSPLISAATSDKSVRLIIKPRNSKSELATFTNCKSEDSRRIPELTLSATDQVS